MWYKKVRSTAAIRPGLCLKHLGGSRGLDDMETLKHWYDKNISTVWMRRGVVVDNYKQGRIYDDCFMNAAKRIKEKFGRYPNYLKTTSQVGWWEYLVEVDGKGLDDD